MHFLADVYVPCEVCRGKRFNEATLRVQFKGKNIAEVLDLSVAEAARALRGHREIRRILRTLDDVGLGYVKLGQPSPTLSGGEAQRIKLSRELARVGDGRTLYILDEPTTGLHFDDVQKLLAVLDRLVDGGQHRGGDRAQPRRHQVRRLGHRPRPRGRRRGGLRHRRGHPRGGGPVAGQPHRPLPRADAGAPPRARPASSRALAGDDTRRPRPASPDGAWFAPERAGSYAALAFGASFFTGHLHFSPHLHSLASLAPQEQAAATIICDEAAALALGLSVLSPCFSWHLQPFSHLQSFGSFAPHLQSAATRSVPALEASAFFSCAGRLLRGGRSRRGGLLVGLVGGAGLLVAVASEGGNGDGEGERAGDSEGDVRDQATGHVSAPCSVAGHVRPFGW